jgi:NAD(P)-dependent dehydrogenase (short-subunit alcohol dehydrogenase family)
MATAFLVKRFTMEDQQWFATQSGDANPIHLDPVTARRSIAGEVVVHGVHALLSCLETHLANGGDTHFAGLTARFLKPVPLDQDVVLERQIEADGTAFLQACTDDHVLFTLRILSGATVTPRGALRQNSVRDMVPKLRSFSELKGVSGLLQVEGDGRAIALMFPHACATLGALRVATLMCISRLVGMECPGLNSLLTMVDVCLCDPESHSELRWEVSRHTVPQAPIRVSVSGGGLSGSVTAFVRPDPVAQPEMAEVAAMVRSGEFAGQRALIVGGSRGLGEVAAKIVAAGGGTALITYSLGTADARRVATEIESAGGRCDVDQFDVLCDDEEARQRLFDWKPTHLYYFATPRIGRSSGAGWNRALSARLQRVYVEGFVRLCLAASIQATEVIRVFYPSTVFLDDLPTEQIEYIAAKAAGEAVCELLNCRDHRLAISTLRLPPMKTDQTASIVNTSAADTLTIMIGVARQLREFGEGARVR